MKFAAVVALLTGTIAWICPRAMLRLWPEEEEAALYLMEAWGIYALCLGLLLSGMDLKAAVAVALALSIPFDLKWGGWMGLVAAATNFGLLITL